MSEYFGIGRFGEGFHVGFPCGLSLSVQFGDGNYCEHYIGKEFATPVEKPLRSRDAEIAIVPSDGGGPCINFPRSGDNILPFASVRDFARLVGLLHGFNVCAGWTRERVRHRLQELVNDEFAESRT